MKKILVGLLIFLAGWANAQIGIDLTEMIPAPDSGYMIITTGDEYPERGLQKYVKAADVLGLDTMFQQGDSLCLLFRHEESYRCFPVHREVRFEKVDEGLRVCWEQRDTVWDTRAYLHFPGTAGSYVRARSVNDFEIGDEDAEIEAQWRKYSTAHEYIYTTNFFSSGNGYSMRPYNSIQHSVRDSSSNVVTANVLNPEYNDNEWHTTTMLYEQATGRVNSTYDDRSATAINLDIGGEYISNSVPLVLGNLGNLNYPLHGDIRYFRFNDEYFDFSEGEGDTIVSNFGTVMDIKGDVSWAVDTLGFTSIDTSHHCEIIPLTDTRLINVEHIGDSVRYTLSDSTIFTVRDSFIPQENIIGWIDDRIPDTVFFAKTSTATKAIEFGDTLELKGGAININIPVEIDYFPATNQLQVCWTEIELPEGGLQQKPGLGEEFGQQENETQQLPADTIRLCDTIQLNDVFIDTVIHDGAGWVFYRNDGKTWSVRDSFRTDDEILDLIEMMNDPQWLTLDRDGNEITIGITEGNEVSFIDSVRTDADIAKVMRDSIVFPDFPQNAIGGKNLIPNSRYFSESNPINTNWVHGTYAELTGMANGIAKYRNFSTSSSARFVYYFSNLDTNKVYVWSLMASVPYRHFRAFVNAEIIDFGKYEMSDSLFVNWVSFRPTAESGTLRCDYGGQDMMDVFFDLYYFQLQEGNYPTTWHPAPEDLEPNLSGIRDTLSTHSTRLLSLEYFRDTLGIPDIASFTHSGDSIHLTMKDGRSWVVPDKHFTEQEIKDLIAQESPVNRSWLLKDGGVPGNASDTVYREGVAVIEGENMRRELSENRDEVYQKKQYEIFQQLFYDKDSNIALGNGLNFEAGAYTISSVDPNDPSNNVQLFIQRGAGIRFYPYGSGQFEAEPTYLLGVDASGYIKEVRPTSGIDTIIHMGDSVFFDFDDKTFTIRDSVRSDAEIISLIEANRIFQQLGRSGDFITLSDGGQVLDLHLKNVTHTGDSIRLHLSDGRILTTRDSSLSVDAVRDMILEEIPETVFYVKQGDVTAPVNWGDIVELENGTVNVNMPTKVKMIDSLNALEVCIWQVVDRTVVDTAIMDYLYFNGVDAYGSSVLPHADNPFDLPAGFRVSFDDPINQEQTLYSNGGEVNNNQFSIRIPTSLEDLSLRVSGSNIIRIDVDDLSPGEVDLIEYKPIGDNIGAYLNGELKDQIPGFNYPFVGTQGRQLGRYNSSNPRLFKGKIYEFWWGDNHYPLTEGSGTTITSTTGAEFTLTNTTWGKDTIITVNELIDTFFQCDTVYLKDWYVKNATFENDTLTLVRSDGIEMSVEIQASGGDGIDTMYSTQDSLYILTSTGRTLSAGVAKGDKGDGLEYHWDGTRLGVRVENSGDPYVYVDLKGEKGDTGEDGREVELRVDSDIIQWRYVGDTWQTLIPLSAIKGEKGDPGPGLEYHWDGTKLGVRKVGDSTYDYVDLKGEKGDPGDVVGDINIYKDDGVILDALRTVDVDSNHLYFDLNQGKITVGDFDSSYFHMDENKNELQILMQDNPKKAFSHSWFQPKRTFFESVKYEGTIQVKSNLFQVDTSGIFIQPHESTGNHFPINGKNRFLRSYKNGDLTHPYVMWDTIKIQDVGITPADTARWGAGGSYTLERDNYRMHLRDAGGASKGSFQLQGSDGVEIYPQANNVFRISGQGITVPSYTTQVSGPAFNLRRDNNTVSTVNFFGTGGINIGGTGSTITIDGSAIGGTQSLGFNTSLNQTTLSGGGGSFRIVGGSNTSVSLSAGGVYTISATGGGSMPSYSFNSQGAMLQLSEDGIQRGSYEVRAGTGLSLSTSGTALNRVVTINASGGTSPWTVSGSNIYRNSGVTVGGTTVGNQFRSYLRSHFYDAVGIFEGSNQRGEMYGSGGDFIITNPTGQTTRITSGYIELDGHVVHKLVRTTIATLVNPVNEIPSNAGSTNFSFSTAPAGTIRYVLNEKSSSITVQGVTIPAGEGKAFMRGTSAWYPISP